MHPRSLDTIKDFFRTLMHKYRLSIDPYMRCATWLPSRKGRIVLFGNETSPLARRREFHCSQKYCLFLKKHKKGLGNKNIESSRCHGMTLESNRILSRHSSTPIFDKPCHLFHVTNIVIIFSLWPYYFHFQGLGMQCGP